MRPDHVTRMLALSGLLFASAPPVFAQGIDSVEHAAAAFDSGDAKGAMAELEKILAREPESAGALYQAARVTFRLGDVAQARAYLEKAVKRAGNYASAWELMTQITQEQGDLARRDEAIARLKLAIGSAIDPAIRRMGSFVRDVLRIENKQMAGLDFFVHGGGDFTRYQFSLIDPARPPNAFLLLRTDVATTENWAVTSMLPPDTVLFHLDMVDKAADGTEKVAIYEYYRGEPDYDTVRVTVLKALRGEIQPLSGQPGSLAGILKK